ncbi:MAG TPA: YbhB/YbcL family Raf kinase inhibitor-like protein [Pseudomonadales bacterium]|nr:YbhB/YbcL family Raf kinase inhibitor-like protein [Pseudomonadales bacterium]
MRNTFILIPALLAGLLLSSCSNQAEPDSTNAATMQITSTAFANGQPIPDKYTGQADDISPRLEWTGAPLNTKSFALICEDPDAPMGTFTHWIIYNVPGTATVLSQNIAKTGTLPDGPRQSKNSFGNVGYNGPMPPPGTMHRYFFRLYALDNILKPDAGADRAKLLNAMSGHVVGKGELMGTYQRE